MGLLEERVFRDNALTAAAIVFLATGLAEALFFVFAPQPSVGRWASITTGEMGFALLALPLFLLARRLLRSRA